MKRKLLAVMMAVCMTASFAGGAATVFAAQEESTAKDEVIVTMPTTSEPEAGFDPAYGWGAGEHVHEPLIQSTLTTTNTDLSIGMIAEKNGFAGSKAFARVFKEQYGVLPSEYRKKN